ncbi:hypothetical protein QYE76_038357 [Lolium multiflorum]|uniref:CCHC-type domain-containing protein n=1 Tax=Lolium multiflorum TaxID=4521 RepID=A0AAD8WR59_LOLMU|nr:hypothetical protein QYE76_038357 [Lolium multiflorum]
MIRSLCEAQSLASRSLLLSMRTLHGATASPTMAAAAAGRGRRGNPPNLDNYDCVDHALLVFLFGRKFRPLPAVLPPRSGSSGYHQRKFRPCFSTRRPSASQLKFRKLAGSSGAVGRNFRSQELPPNFRASSGNIANLAQYVHASNELWRIIVEGFKPYNPDKLTRREAVDSQLNNTALHMIQTSVGTKDLSRVRNFTTAKEAWDGLAASCIGSESTRRNKYNALRNKAEGFMRLPDEDHEVMYGRLLTVADAFRNVGATHINDSWIKEKYIDCMMPFEPIDVKTLVGRECYPSLTSQQAVHEMQALKVLEQNSHDSRNRALGMSKGSNLALVVNSVEEVIPQESYRASWSMSYPEDLEHHYHDHMAFHANTFWVDPSKAKEDNIKRNNSRGFTSSGPRTRSCYNCDDKRHFIAECPYENRETHGGRLIPKDKSKDSKGKYSKPPTRNSTTRARRAKALKDCASD